jgi:hypothetical protein
MVCHLSAFSDPLDDGARQLHMRTSFAGKSKGNLGGGPTLYRSRWRAWRPGTSETDTDRKGDGNMRVNVQHMLPSLLSTIGAKQSASGAAFLDSPSSISMVRADFVSFASKVVLISPNLLITAIIFKNYAHIVWEYIGSSACQGAFCHSVLPEKTRLHEHKFDGYIVRRTFSLLSH